MQQLNNLPAYKLDNIKKFLQERLSIWANDWTLAGHNLQIDASYISKADINIGEMKFYCASTKIVLVDENQFQWGKAIFSDIDLPVSANCLDLIRTTRADLLKILTNENAFVEQKTCKLPAHIDIFLSINIHSVECGSMSVIVPFTCLFNVLQIKRVSTKYNLLTKKAELVDAQPCKLSVRLNFGEFLLNEMSDLKVGTILRSSIGIENKFTLESNEILLANVAIGKISNEKVFMVINGEKK